MNKSLYKSMNDNYFRLQLSLQDEVGGPKMSTFCQRFCNRKCQRRVVSVQKSQNLVNIVCERHLRVLLYLKKKTSFKTIKVQKCCYLDQQHHRLN